MQEALKFMRHSKRVTLSTDDINSALVASGKEVALLSPSVFAMQTSPRDKRVDYEDDACCIAASLSMVFLHAAHLRVWQPDSSHLWQRQRLSGHLLPAGPAL